MSGEPMDYTCGTCGDRGLIIACHAGHWTVRCSNGHELFIGPASDFIVTIPAGTPITVDVD